MVRFLELNDFLVKTLFFLGDIWKLGGTAYTSENNTKVFLTGKSSSDDKSFGSISSKKPIPTHDLAWRIDAKFRVLSIQQFLFFQEQMFNQPGGLAFFAESPTDDGHEKFHSKDNLFTAWFAISRGNQNVINLTIFFV